MMQWVRIRNFSIGLGCLLLLSCITSWAQPMAVVTNLRISRQLQKTRLVFDVSKFFHYRYFELARPNRLVVDLYPIKQRFNISEFRLLGTAIKDIREAMHPGHRLRIVFDLAKKMPVKILRLSATAKHPERLVIDLKKTRVPIIGFNQKSQPQIVQSSVTKPVVAKSAIVKSVVAHSVISKPYIPQLRKRSRKVIIVIDPGHGGKDPGATGPGGHHEKTVVLAIGKDLKRMIDRQPGFEAKLTRKGDCYITLWQRLAIARKDHADMFISIHADAFHKRHSRGASVFALSQNGATSAAARWLARRENASEMMGGVNLADKTRLLKSVLINLAQTATIRHSLKIGQDVIQFLRKVTVMHHPTVEQAGFVVLKSPDIPSLLVETGFITNPKEERQLISSRYQHRLARAIMRGIVEYFRDNPPRGTWLALQRQRKNRHA